MPLRELQSLAHAAFAGGPVAPLVPHVRSSVLPKDVQIDIYRNNATEIFRKALAASYPTIAALVGVDCFRMLARYYTSSFESRTGNLIDFGSAFAAFLTTRYGGGEFGYLPDVARLDWAMERSLIAADAGPLDLGTLATVRVEDQAALRFDLHPSLRLVSSSYPIFSIWRMHHADAIASPVHVDAGGECVLVARANDDVVVRAIGVAEYTFVRALLDGQTLESAANAAATDPGPILMLLAGLDQLVRFHPR